MAEVRPLIIRSCAKINLAIEVLGRRPDHYHEIRTLFQAIDFCDRLEFRPGGEGIRVRGDDPDIPWDEQNLIYRAASLLKIENPDVGGVEIVAAKHIPPGRGLGGGSSNAAMALYGLNAVWKLGLGDEELRARASRLGADVPYFLDGGLCLGEGRGDKVTPLPDLATLYCVLVLASFPVSTAEIYSRLSLTSGIKGSKISEFLARREFGQLENHLEETILSLYPRLKAIKGFFLEREAVLSLVSGSGSAVFGLYRERPKAAQALAEWEEIEEEKALLVETLSRERYWSRVTAGV
jgi:4-diphosphocytidyl-2-C-methyl-D-erythritol kinase